MLEGREVKRTLNPKRKSKERILLSDVLPFEIPLSFSNRHFYELIISLKVHFDEKGEICYDRDSSICKELVGKVFNGDMNKTEQTVSAILSILLNGEQNDKGDITIPYLYRIIHKDIDYRELAIVHPRNQLRVMEYIDKYKHLITYFCSLSPFSIRHPSKVSMNAESFHATDIPSDDESYFYLDNFFLYSRYRNLHEFYESQEYHRCETRFDNLFKFDIAKCFDSIYTHSISWAIYNKEAVKREIGKSKHTFAGKFDSLMQALSYNETNGIVIGPEFSRVFAEMILQRIDRDVHEGLPQEIKHKQDYELFRYVDDYFLFYNDPSTRDCVVDHYELRLREYKLSINHSKSELIERPIITKMTIFKSKIKNLLNNINLPIYELGSFLNSSTEFNEDEVQRFINKIKKAVHTSNAKVDFKLIVKESGTELKEVLPYTIGLLANRVSDYLRIISLFNNKNVVISEGILQDSLFILNELLDTVFYIYSMAPRVNSTIKLCRIINSVTIALNDRQSLFCGGKHRVYKFIFDRTADILKRNTKKKYARLESLYLLVVLKELGKQYWFEEDTLEKYLGLRNSKGLIDPEIDLDYFQITVILFYVRDKKRYSNIRCKVTEIASKRLAANDLETNKKKTESVLLLLDLVCCPYIENTEKVNLLKSFGLDSNFQEIIDAVIYRRYWFTKWSHFNIRAELEAKKSKQVY